MRVIPPAREGYCLRRHSHKSAAGRWPRLNLVPAGHCKGTGVFFFCGRRPQKKRLPSPSVLPRANRGYRPAADFLEPAIRETHEH